MTSKTKISLAVTLAALALAGCGGGGDDSSGTGGSSTATTAEGAYAGSLTGSTTASVFNVLVLEDGQYWALYGNNVGGALMVSGLIQGQGTSSNGTFSSSTLKDFGYMPALSGSLNATYVAGASLAGAATFTGGQSVTFNATAIPATSFDYNAPATLTNIAGNWSLSSTSGNRLSIAIAANGSFTGSDQYGCNISGSLAPRASGKNVYNLQMTMGPAPCALPNWSATGVALYTTLASGAHQLLVGAVDVSRTYGSFASGTR